MYVPLTVHSFEVTYEIGRSAHTFSYYYFSISLPDMYVPLTVHSVEVRTKLDVVPIRLVICISLSSFYPYF